MAVETRSPVVVSVIHFMRIRVRGLNLRQANS